MSMRYVRQILWRLAALRTGPTAARESQLATITSRVISSSVSKASMWSSQIRDSKTTTIRLWHLMREMAAGNVKKTGGPRGRLLVGGAVAFLWEKERISTNEAINYLKEYDERVKSKLSTLMEEPVPGAVLSLPSPATDESSPSSRLLSERLFSLQNDSEKKLSTLPLVGLRKMGPLSSASVKAGEVFHRVASKAISRLNEALVHVQQPEEDQDWDNLMIAEETTNFSDIRENTEITQVDDNLTVDDSTDLKYSEPLLQYYTEQSNRHMAELPLVGLRDTGSLYLFSRYIADSVITLFTADSYIYSQVRFLKHLGISLWDTPSLPVVSYTYTSLDDVGLTSEGLTTSSLKDSLHAAYEQGKKMLSLCTSPRLLMGTFDSLSENKGEYMEEVTAQEVCNTHATHGVPTAKDDMEREELATEDYLKRNNWECFAKATNCTVYRKPHTSSGLFMYKVIGRYSDISIKDFVHVQVDHSCRKEWDSYVQKLETVDTDPDTGTEVVQWIMKFPFPMSSREYLYVRRIWLNKDFAVLINRSVIHPSVPVTSNCVRVNDYISCTVMQPHTTYDEDGFEYEVTYYDDPQTTLPSSCVNWVATAAMPEFLTEVHAAAYKRKLTIPRQSMIKIVE